MGLIATYSCAELGATLEITAANTSNGQGSATLKLEDATVGMNLHYHFEGNSGPKTVMQFWGSDIYGWTYSGAAGYSESTDGSSGIELSGAVSTLNGIVSFSGKFLQAEAV